MRLLHIFLHACACLQYVAAMDLEVQVYYPARGIRNLPSGAVFSLVLCHVEGCPSTGAWNMSMPGVPYGLAPELNIFNDSYAGNDLYVKHVAIPGDGPVFVTVSACMQPAGNPFGNSSIIGYCDDGALDPVSNACVHVGMPFRSVAVSPGHAIVTAYPYFGMAAGSVSTMFKNLHSPQLGNDRDISVYVPASLRQNSVRREVNVLVVNDGTPFYMQQLAFPGGFDRAVLTGAVPETIMVGIPQNGTGCERQFELTFSVSNQTNCKASGGNSQYFDFIQSTVVPAVLKNMNAIQGEISITGTSYGGLTSCYAASARPHYFSRAFCQSPSVWWNYGQLPSVIEDNARLNGLPKSVVMYLGTTEMEIPLPTSPAHTKTASWYSYVNKTAEAWRAVGLNASNLRLFTMNGGFHDATAWATTFSEGIIQMYTPQFTARFQEQYAPGLNLNVVFPVRGAVPAASGADAGPRAFQAVNEETAVVAVVVVSVVALAGSWLYVKRNYVRKDAVHNPTIASPLLGDLHGL